MAYEKLTLAVCIFLLPVTLTAQQNTIDSIEKLIPSQKDSLLAKSYNELTWQYRTIDQDKSIDYGNKAIALGNKINFSKAVAQAYNDLGIIYYDQQDFNSALASYKKAFDIRSKLNDQKGIGLPGLHIANHTECPVNLFDGGIYAVTIACLHHDK